MEQIRLSQIARRLGQSIKTDRMVEDIVTDSRRVKEGAVFVAIRGETFDGNDFAAGALENGAAAVVIDRPVLPGDPRAFLVEDSKRALISLGGLVRDRYPIPFVGVTGSVGKTTTKDFIHTVLSCRFHTLKNEGNQNNEIGVPNTLFQLTPQHQAAVIEMGMSQKGEIRDLTLAVRPSVGVITFVGVSHLEALKSREGILQAKLELLEGMPDGAPLFLCGDNDLLAGVCSDRLSICRYGIENRDCALRAEAIEQRGTDSTAFQIRSPWGTLPAVIPTAGRHNVLDALAAFGVGCALGIPPADAAAALSRYRPSGMRQKKTRWKNATVVEDCYNCSPDSLRAAARTLAGLPCEGRRILVLSDMLELGAAERRMHEEAGRFAAGQGLDLLLAFGPLSEETIRGALAAGLLGSRHFPDWTSLADFLWQEVGPGDIVWFKASRGMQLERVFEALYRKEAPQ